LYRPVGLKELELIYDSDCEAFPPRLPHQPIFYPVLNFEYAKQIACDWNTKDEFSGFAGYVTKFEVAQNYIENFEPKMVGNSNHQEFWILAEELGKFNNQIIDKIVVESACFGEKFIGYIPDRFGMKDKNADKQIVMLSISLDYSSFDFYCEISANHKTVFLNYLYWKQGNFEKFGLSQEQKMKVLEALKEVWEMKSFTVKLM